MNIYSGLLFLHGHISNAELAQSLARETPASGDDAASPQRCTATRPDDRRAPTARPDPATGRCPLPAAR